MQGCMSSAKQLYGFTKPYKAEEHRFRILSARAVGRIYPCSSIIQVCFEPKNSKLVPNLTSPVNRILYDDGMGVWPDKILIELYDAVNIF